METMNDLLEKYFRGETSLAEEQVLKNYFLSGQISAEHELYKALFDTFEEEKQYKSTAYLKMVADKQSSGKHIWIKTLSYSGIAAALILALCVVKPAKQSDTFAIISGKRIESTEYAQKYAEAKMLKVNNILRSSMKPMRSLSTVRKGLEPLRKISETKEKIEEIKNKVQF
jgi:hypothetical protein